MTRTPALALLVACAAGACTLRERADLILHGAVFWTGETRAVEAVAIAGGRFLAVGSARDVLVHRGPETQIVDVSGFAMPGWSDAFVRFAEGARHLEFNLDDIQSAADLEARLRRVVPDLEPRDWIASEWPGGAASPTLDAGTIDALTPANPVVFRDSAGRVTLVNSAARRQWGGATDGPVPPDSRSRRIQQTLRALAEIRRLGITKISDYSDALQYEIYRALHLQRKLTVRVHMRLPFSDIDSVIARGIRVGSGDSWLTLGTVYSDVPLTDADAVRLDRAAAAGVQVSAPGVEVLGRVPGSLRPRGLTLKSSGAAIALFDTLRPADGSEAYALASGWPKASPAGPRMGLDPLQRLQNSLSNGGWTIEQALRASTYWPAWASFEENGLGTIQQGKRADLTILDRNLLAIPSSQIGSARVIMTVVDGRVVYQNRRLRAGNP